MLPKVAIIWLAVAIAAVVSAVVIALFIRARASTANKEQILHYGRKATLAGLASLALLIIVNIIWFSLQLLTIETDIRSIVIYLALIFLETIIAIYLLIESKGGIKELWNSTVQDPKELKFIGALLLLTLLPALVVWMIQSLLKFLEPYSGG